MNLNRVVLNQPFMRFPAGTVFELEEPNEVSGWDPDERVREKQSFTDKRCYFLPDTGRGISTLLPLWMTEACPPNVFESADLLSGPCRITGIFSGKGEAAEPHDGFEKLRENDVLLQEGKQGIDVNLPENREKSTGWQVHNMLTKALVLENDLPVKPGNLAFDFSGLMPGFYALRLQYTDNNSHLIRFFKSFPLLVQFEPGSNWKFTLSPTQY